MLPLLGERAIPPPSQEVTDQLSQNAGWAAGAGPAPAYRRVRGCTQPHPDQMTAAHSLVAQGSLGGNVTFLIEQLVLPAVAGVIMWPRQCAQPPNPRQRPAKQKCATTPSPRMRYKNAQGLSCSTTLGPFPLPLCTALPPHSNDDDNNNNSNSKRVSLGPSEATGKRKRPARRNRTPGCGWTTTILSTHSHVDKIGRPSTPPWCAKRNGDPMPFLGRQGHPKD